MKKRIILLDNKPYFADLLKETLADDPNWETSLVTTTKKEFFEALAKCSYDVALIEYSIEDKNDGLEVLEQMKKCYPKVPVMVISAYFETLHALNCLKAGAKGYINKIYISSDLVKGLNELISGGLYVSGDEGKKIIEAYKKTS